MALYCICMAQNSMIVWNQYRLWSGHISQAPVWISDNFLQSVTINSQSQPSLALCLWKHPRTCLELFMYVVIKSFFGILFPIKITRARSMMILVVLMASLVPMTTSPHYSIQRAVPIVTLCCPLEHKGQTVTLDSLSFDRTTLAWQKNLFGANKIPDLLNLHKRAERIQAK